jgi:hypothetical protein
MARSTGAQSHRSQSSAGVDLISDALPFGRLWYGEPNAVSNAIGDLRLRRAERVAYLILWKRLKSVAGAEFARLSTGARITRGNSGNGVLLTRENRAGQEQKSRNGKFASVL